MQVDMLISNDDFMNSIIFLRKINLYLRTALNLRLTNAEKHQQFSLPSSLPVLCNHAMSRIKVKLSAFSTTNVPLSNECQTLFV